MDTSNVKKYIPFIVMPAFLVIVELGSLALSLPVRSPTLPHSRTQSPWQTRLSSWRSSWALPHSSWC